MLTVHLSSNILENGHCKLIFTKTIGLFLQLWFAIGDTVFGFILAFFLYTLIESPFDTLLKKLVILVSPSKKYFIIILRGSLAC